MKRRDFIPEMRFEFPKIELRELRYLWHGGYWDGPLNGLLLYQGEKVWFEVFDEPEDGSPVVRKFLLIRLTPEQLKEEEYWHELFRKSVGVHTDYDSDGKRPIGALRPKSEWKHFYEAYKQRIPRDLSDNEIIGWFED